MIPNWYADCLRQAEAVASKPLVFFILGCQKSGTTWAQILANAHPQVACRGEGHYADMLAAVMMNALQTYNNQKATTVNFENPHLMSATRLLIDQHLAATIAQKDSPEQVLAVGDKTPEHAVGIPTLNGLYPGARFVHIIRDGRDSCVSGWAHLGREGGQGKFKAFADYAEYFASRHWVPYIRSARAAAAQMPGRFLELRYEALITDPVAEATRLFGFLGVDTSERVVADAVERSSFKSITKGRDAGQESATSFFRKGVVGDWMERFDDEATQRFEQGAGGMLRELGYENATAGA